MSILGNIFKHRSNSIATRKMITEKERATYEAIKDQPELAPVSKKLATRSIVFSCLSMLIIVVALIGIYFAISEFFVENFLLALVSVIIGGFIAIWLSAVFFAKALTCLIYQLKLNKRPIAWVALAFVILPAIVLIAGIIIVVAVFAGA